MLSVRRLCVLTRKTTDLVGVSPFVGSRFLDVIENSHQYHCAQTRLMWMLREGCYGAMRGP